MSICMLDAVLPTQKFDVSSQMRLLINTFYIWLKLNACYEQDALNAKLKQKSTMLLISCVSLSVMHTFSITLLWAGRARCGAGHA